MNEEQTVIPRGSSPAKLSGVTYVGADLAGDIGPEEYARAADLCQRFGIREDPAKMALVIREVHGPDWFRRATA